VRNSANYRGRPQARVLHPRHLSMGDDSRLVDSPFDEGKLRVVREFLRREFRDCSHRDFVVFDEAVFVIETGRGSMLTLVIPKATFENQDFVRLLNAQLAETLELERASRVVLTPQGPIVRA
jgi:hypothetical protein